MTGQCLTQQQNITTTREQCSLPCDKYRPYNTLQKARHFMKNTEDVIKGLNDQIATATADSRLEVKLDPCAQLF